MLWLTLCVACFLGGRYWDKVTSTTGARPVAIPRSTTLTSLHLLAGSTATISTKFRHNRVLVADPTIVSIVPNTSSTFTVSARRTGSTEITVWREGTGKTVTYSVSVAR
jgi:Flp pilus assembly secretin CpaC